MVFPDKEGNMIRKIFVIAIIAVLVFTLVSCEGRQGRMGDSSDVSESEVPYTYTDSEIDISMTIDTPGWSYHKEDAAGMVVFYMPQDYDGLTNFAISANTARQDGMSADDLDETIDYMAQASKDDLKNGMIDVDWQMADPLIAGQYDAQRYSFTAKLRSTGSRVRGDYIFWWSEKKLYICSFITFSDIYEENFEVLKSALYTFDTLDK